MENNLARLTCNVEQSQTLVGLGIDPLSFLLHYEAGNVWRTTPPDVANCQPGWPAWTKAELDAMIGPRFQKPDLWNDERITKAQDPNAYPVFTLGAVLVYDNGAVASAAGLIFLLESDLLTADECNDRYEKVFLRYKLSPNGL